MRQPDHFLFYSESIQGDLIALDSEETSHLVSVLRAKEGHPFQVTDGKGMLYTCTLIGSDRHGSSARITARTQAAPPSPIVHTYIGIPGRDELEWAIDALVPLGVSRIIPVICAQCQKKWWTPSWEKHAVRFRRKCIAALKQSLNPFMPDISEPVPFARAVASAQGKKLVADMDGVPLHSLVVDAVSKDPITCFIGPPGGFSDEESTHLKSAGTVGVKLSENRLRTELAGVVMCGGVMSGCRSLDSAE